MWFRFRRADERAPQGAGLSAIAERAARTPWGGGSPGRPWGSSVYLDSTRFTLCSQRRRGGRRWHFSLPVLPITRENVSGFQSSAGLILPAPNIDPRPRRGWSLHGLRRRRILAPTT